MHKTTVKAWLAATASLIAFGAMAQTSSGSMADPDTGASDATSASSAHTGRSTGRSIADKTITTKIDAKFLADAQIKSRNLKVHTYKGVVHLSGTAETQEQADHAVAVAQDVDGVRNVKSTIKITAAQ